MSTYNIGQATNVNITQSNQVQGEAVRLLLVGRTGSGKSSSGNTILDDEKFDVDFSAASVTKRPYLEEGGKFTDESVLKVMDTPGLFDTDATHEDTAKQLQEALANMYPGPHAILYVVSLGQPYSEEDFKTFQRLKTYFDPRFLQYTIVVFTHRDRLVDERKPLDSFLKDSTVYLKTVLQECGMRYVAFNNKDRSDRKQVEALFDKVQEFGKVFYSRPVFSMDQIAETVQAADRSEIMESSLYRTLIDELEVSKVTNRKVLAENEELRKRKESVSSGMQNIKNSLVRTERCMYLCVGLMLVMIARSVKM